MSARNQSVEWLILGVVLIVAAATGFYKAEIAYLQHTMIPYKSNSMSPAQAFLGSVLSLAFGFYCLVLWRQQRRK